ncbi:MAG: hypothetical protein ACRD2B_01500, partial [Terriglobia bacterium]
MKSGRYLSPLVAAILLCVCAATLPATQTEFWRVGTFKGFLAGTLQGVSVSMNGQLTLAPETKAIFNPDETVALSVVGDAHGNLYIGTGHQGKVFKLNSQLEGKLLFQAPEPEILAMAVGPEGDLYVGSSPEGKIYRVTPQGQSSVFYSPKVKYIWALAFDAQGRLYVGTGDRGEILRISRQGKGEVFFSSNQTHIMCLTFDKDGNLLAGSEPGGLIYRINPEGKAFVLYQAALPEIHSLATDAEGDIYAAVLGNSAAPGMPGYFHGPGTPTLVSQPAVQTVTVVASGGNASGDPAKAQQTAPAPKHSHATKRVNPSVSAGYAPPYQRFAPGRGSLIEIFPNYSAQTLWTSNTESIFGLATQGSDVLFSTDANGHIFDLRSSPDGPMLTLLTETRESLPTRILARGSDLYVATSNIAKLIQIGTSIGTGGTYESGIKDAKFISRWGEISWRAEVPAGCRLKFYTRSGNSKRPDNTWSDWSSAYVSPDGNAIGSTPARYLQWKAVFQASGQETPELSEVTISYLNQNLPPEIRSLTITDGSQRSTLTGVPIVTGGMVTPVSTIPSPEPASVTYDGVGTWTPPADRPPITISWRASDPNQDQLTYSLYLKSADERQWHLLKRNVRETSFGLQPDSLPDGQYQVRLVASDSPSNPPAQALQTKLVSAPFWVDNSPPEIKVVSQSVEAGSAIVHFEAVSKMAPLCRAEISSGNGEWKQIVSNDGIVDARQETFTVKVRNLKEGEHVILLK